MDKEQIKNILTDNLEIQEIVETGVENVDKITTKLINTLNKEVQFLADDKGWPITVLMALAKTTANMLLAFQLSSNAKEKGVDFYNFYTERILPSTKNIVYKEFDKGISSPKDNNPESNIDLN